MSKSNPRKLPLTLILIGTTILAFPAAGGIGCLLYDFVFVNRSSQHSVFSLLSLLFIIAGFVIFGGYYSTAKSNRYNKFHWLASAVYNLALSIFYLYFVIDDLIQMYDFPQEDAHFIIQNYLRWLQNPLLLLPIWTIFVAISSFYYFKFIVSKQNSELP